MTEDRLKQKARRAQIRQRNLVEKQSPHKPKRHKSPKTYSRERYVWEWDAIREACSDD